MLFPYCKPNGILLLQQALEQMSADLCSAMQRDSGSPEPLSSMDADQDFLLQSCEQAGPLGGRWTA